LLFPKVKRFGSFSLKGEGWDERNFIVATFLIPPQSAIRPAGKGVLFLNSTLSDYTHVRHTRRERVFSAMDGKLEAIHGAWITAIHAGMTILENIDHLI